MGKAPWSTRLGAYGLASGFAGLGLLSCQACIWMACECAERLRVDIGPVALRLWPTASPGWRLTLEGLGLLSTCWYAAYRCLGRPTPDDPRSGRRTAPDPALSGACATIESRPGGRGR